MEGWEKQKGIINYSVEGPVAARYWMGEIVFSGEKSYYVKCL
jgi:hypothetical protein